MKKLIGVIVTLFVCIAGVVALRYALEPRSESASSGTDGKMVDARDVADQTARKDAEPTVTPKAEGRAREQSAAKARPTIERNRVKPGSVKRLPGPTTLKTVVTTTGKAEKADWGIKGMASFILTSYVDCDVEILKKEETSGGEIKVVERRTFTTAKQELKVSEADVALSLYDTLPLDKVLGAVKTIGIIMMKLGEPDVAAAGASMLGGATATDAVLKSVDGKSAREVLGAYGTTIPKGIEEKVNEFIEQEVKISNPVKISDIAGRSYVITYYQDKDTGARKAPPLRVDIRRADGNGELSDEEWAILRRANAFLDCQVADAECRPGDSRKVNAADFECLFDPYVDGSYSGSVTIERTDDMENGDWHLRLRPGSIAIVADNGASAGEVRLESGEAQIDKDSNVVKSMIVMGKASAKKLSTHHMLFNARMGGMCNFRAMLTSEPKTK